ncbi:MAG: DivIVA domain-containing protein [Bacteroidota bacterium]
MQITPIEIRKKRFEKKWRGYHTDEVDAFLHAIAHAWEKMLTNLQKLEETVEYYKKEVSRLQGLESVLLKTIRIAETTAENTRAQAQKEAELIVQEAHNQATQLRQEAQQKVQALEVASKEKAADRQHHLYTQWEETRKAIRRAQAYCQDLSQRVQQLGEEILAKGQSMLQEDAQAVDPFFADQDEDETSCD